MTQLLLEILKILEIHLLVWILIKVYNPTCITLTDASVELQYGEILCLTDAIDKWSQRRDEQYRSRKSDMHERRRREGVRHCILKSSFARHRGSVRVYCKVIIVFILYIYYILALSTFYYMCENLPADNLNIYVRTTDS
jgi:hypothetical protein